MRIFMIFTVLLSLILIVVSLLFGPLMGIFAMSTIVCLWIDKNKEEIKK